MPTTLTIKLNFGTSRPFMRFRYEDGDWQLSNTFEVQSGNGPYQFSAIDSLGCIAKISIKEDDLDFPDGNGTLTISKTVTSGGASDNATFFQFSVDGPVSFENILVSADEPMVLENLPFGTYTVRENDPPSGYLNNDESKQVTLSDSNKSDGTAFVNEIDPDGVDTGPGSITINKVVTNEEPTFGDATFRVNVVGPNIYYGLPVTINTPQVLSDIPVGTYSIEEVGLPDGFFLNAVTPNNPELTEDNPDWTVKIFNTFGKENTGPGSMTISKKVLKTKDSQTTDVGDFSVLETGLAVDESLHDTLTGVSFDLLEAGSPVNIHTSGAEGWEQDAVSHGWGGIMEDHEGNLRVYYGLRNINGVNGKNAPCLSKSTDNGATFIKVRNNLNPTIINNTQSNIIKVPSPSGVSDDAIESLQITYDPYGKTSERYKAVTQWQGKDGVWASASKDGLTFGSPVKIMDPAIGDSYYSGMFYDLENKKYVVYGRGRKTNVPPASGPPKPYGTRRYVVRAESLNWNDTPWATKDVTVLDPATEWSYTNNADSSSFWDEVTNACGTRWEPVGTGESRPNIYLGNARDYKGYYIGIFPVYFRHDDRVPYARPERTTGPIYPVFAISKDGSSWSFPDNDKAFLDMGLYERTETNPCHTSQEIPEVGQVYSGFQFARKAGKFFTAAMNRPDTHYEAGISDFDHNDRRIDVFSMREDGFGRITGTGTWTTPNFVLNELTASIILNSAGQVDVEILNSSGSVIANFARADFSTITADNVDNECSWAGTLADLTGQTIALKFYLDNASVYSYSLVAGDVDQNDELFTGDLQGEITIEGLQFSVNDPAEIQNLPLGTYLFEEDAKSGWLLKSIDPLETTLTEDEPSGEVLVTNEFGGDDPELGGDEVWLAHNDGSDTVLYKARFSNSAFTETILSKNVGDLGTTYDTSDDFVVLPNGNVICVLYNNSTELIHLHFFDSQFNLLASHTFDTVGIFSYSATSRYISSDEDDNVYVIASRNEFNERVSKYDSNGNLIWTSGNVGIRSRSQINVVVCGVNVVFSLCDNSTENTALAIINKEDGSSIFFDDAWRGDISNRAALTLLDNDRLLIFNSDAGSTVSPNPDPEFLIIDNEGNISEVIVGSDITGFDSVEFNGTSQYIESYPIDTGDDVVYLTVRTGTTPNVWELRRVNLTTKEVEGVCEFTEDVNLSGIQTINFTDDNEHIIIGHYGLDANTTRPGLTIIDKATMTQVGQFVTSGSGLGIGNGYMPTLHKRNWQLEYYESTPPPPTGTATITVNKTIQDGLAADDDVEFTVNVYGPVNLLNRTVTANTPLVLEDLPFGSYRVIEKQTYPGQFELESISPNDPIVSNGAIFSLSEDNDSQTVAIVNRKMDSSEEFVTGQLTIEDILDDQPPTKAYTEIEIQDTGATPSSGSITVKYKGVNVTLSYNEFMTPATVAQALAGEIENDGSIELSATVPSSRILRLTEKTSGAAGNSSQTGSTVSVSFTNNTHISTGTDIYTLQGGSDPAPNFIELYYPWDGDGSSLYPMSPKVNILYADTDTPAEVAEALRVATNAADINLTATRTDATLTFTEKRAGPSYAGNVIRVLTNGQTIEITPTNGKITMS